MAIKKSVFGSSTEKRNYYKLRRAWGKSFNIYHNLPLLNVIDISNNVDVDDPEKGPLKVDDMQFNFLKKTSIDYTLCDKHDTPMLCIEFDGMQQGYNVKAKYYKGENSGSSVKDRQRHMELKLKVALGSGLPFFVVSSKEFSEISTDASVTIVDGIIGEVMANQSAHKEIESPGSYDKYGFNEDRYEQLSSEEKAEFFSDYITTIEVLEEMKNNPVSRLREELMRELDIRSYGMQGMSEPDPESIEWVTPQICIEKRQKAYGSRFILHTEDHGDIMAEAWLPNYEVPWFSGIGLVENIAAILALNKLKALRCKRT